MSQLKCGCIYATTQNTPAVRTGHEMGGYLKEPCELHRRAPQPVDAGGEGVSEDVEPISGNGIKAEAGHIDEGDKKIPSILITFQPDDFASRDKFFDMVKASNEETLRRLSPKAEAGPDANETADQAMELANFFEGVRVFVTTREKMKAPEGVDLFDEHVTKLILLAAKIRQLARGGEEA